ncbi:MAG: MBL fold metallo-hydrolase [Calditrichaeota bacterium]|nr:MAG: MBL fold metallo-hydrolase [Calditrichota bacterium]
MATLTFLGAAGTVTGSRHLLTIQGKNYLIDCGLFQGEKQNRLKNWEPFAIPPQTIDRVFLTHAHIDHSGWLPRLSKEGFGGPIHCTYSTADLCEIMLKDSAHLQEEDAKWANKKGFSKHKPALPLYTVDDADKVLSRFKPLYYGQDYFDAIPGYRVKFKDAGHILGASFIEIKKEIGNTARKLLFGGDFGRAVQPLLKAPTQVFNIDYLILESTYGNRLHSSEDPDVELVRVINESSARGGVLVIPAFAVGRTQALLYKIREFEEKGLIPVLPVYVDSPMAIESVDVYSKHPADLNLLCRIEVYEGKNLFRPKKLHICRTREESQAINSIKKEAIIISSSGMATGGRILHHLAERLPIKNNTVLFIGYQAVGTRGRTIQEGNPTVKIHGRDIPIHTHVESIEGASAHGDYNEIIAWLMGFNKAPEKVYIVHGDPESSLSLAGKIRDYFGWEVVIPKLFDRFEIDI